MLFRNEPDRMLNVEFQFKIVKTVQQLDTRGPLGRAQQTVSKKINSIRTGATVRTPNLRLRLVPTW